MNANKPVAWMHQNPDYAISKHQSLEYNIPLYTHPVKELGNPVAWRSKDRDGYWCIYQSPVKGAEPLYTGFKELTDEDIEKNTDYWADKANWIKKNEPVAWMFQGAFDISTYVSFEKPNPDIYPNPTPLYTHPVKELTLSPEKIIELQAEYGIDSDLTCHSVKDFVLAILRKAQEK